MYYLYLLPCSDKKYMKIGVSSIDIERIITHHKSYNIILDGVRILNCRTKSLSYKVEKYLLDRIPNPKFEIKKKDGSSELRDIKYASRIIPILKGIKDDISFTYAESNYIEYKLYKLEEWCDYLKNSGSKNIETQLEKIRSIGSVGEVTSYNTPNPIKQDSKFFSEYKIKSADQTRKMGKNLEMERNNKRWKKANKKKKLKE